MTARALQALRFLRLVDGEGYRLHAMDEIRGASSEVLPRILASVVRNAYGEVFAKLDVSRATDGQLADAFRRFEPAAQRSKMIALFVGLCRWAALMPSESVPEQRNSRSVQRSRVPLDQVRAGGISPVVQAVVDALPPTGRWTAEQRLRWLKAMEGAIDLAISVDDATSAVGGPNAH